MSRPLFRCRFFTAVSATVILTGLVLWSGDIPAASAGNGPERKGALAVGWHDEFDRSPKWQWIWPLPRGGAAVSSPKRGILRLRMGEQSESGPTLESPPRTYYWASAYRYVTVDLDRYPILAVRAVRIAGDNTWWDVIFQEYLGGWGHGPETRASLQNAQTPGLLLFDVPGETRMTGKKQLRLRLNVAGLKRGGTVDYDYVRFIRREDAARLRESPDLQKVEMRP